MEEQDYAYAYSKVFGQVWFGNIAGENLKGDVNSFCVPILCFLTLVNLCVHCISCAYWLVTLLALFCFVSSISVIRQNFCCIDFIIVSNVPDSAAILTIEGSLSQNISAMKVQFHQILLLGYPFIIHLLLSVITCCRLSLLPLRSLPYCQCTFLFAF